VRGLSRHFVVTALMSNYEVLIQYYKERVNKCTSNYCLNILTKPHYRVALNDLNNVLEDLAPLQIPPEKLFEYNRRSLPLTCIYKLHFHQAWSGYFEALKLIGVECAAVCLFAFLFCIWMLIAIIICWEQQYFVDFDINMYRSSRDKVVM
jgi:hypothetical protein